MPSKAFLMLRSAPPGPRFARPEDRLRAHLEARTTPMQPCFPRLSQFPYSLLRRGRLWPPWSHTTLPYSLYQNAKQEAFWGPVEGRLMAMLDEVPDLTLAQLNETTQAWVEYEYNRKRHSEIGETPVDRFLAGPTVTRPCPDSTALKLAFTRAERRALRNSDGTIVIAGRRFEVPNRYRHLTTLGTPSPPAF